MNASVPLIKLSSAEGTVLFLQFIFLKMAGWDYLFQKMKCFSLFITLSYSVNQVRLMENVFTYNLAKSTPYLHRVTFCKGP